MPSDIEILLNSLNPDRRCRWPYWHYCICCKTSFTHAVSELEKHQGHLYVTFKNTRRQEVKH